MNVEHLLLTRFNVQVPGFAEQYGERYLDDEWLAGRLRLFNSYCLPGVLNQLTQDFRWYIFVDSGTPRTLLDKLTTGLPRLAKVVSIHGVLTAQSLESTISAGTTGRPDRRITSRLDSDDVLAPTYMATVQRVARREQDPQCLFAINFPIGMQASGRKTYITASPKGPFVSLVEPAASSLPWGVLSLEHRNLGQSVAVKQRYGRPAWVQVLHGGNLANRVRGVRAPRRWINRMTRG